MLDSRRILLVDLNNFARYPSLAVGSLAASLRKAGAQAVTGVALGKFGNQLRGYDIDIQSDPYQPIPMGKFKVVHSAPFPGTTNPVSQQVLQALIP